MSVNQKLLSYFSTKNIYCGCSKDSSFEHQKFVLKLMGKKIFSILLAYVTMSKGLGSLLLIQEK